MKYQMTFTDAKTRFLGLLNTRSSNIYRTLSPTLKSTLTEIEYYSDIESDFIQVHSVIVNKITGKIKNFIYCLINKNGDVLNSIDHSVMNNIYSDGPLESLPITYEVE